MTNKSTRRQFMRRSALVAAGGLLAPSWLQWFGEQMDKLRPKLRVFVAQPRSGLVPKVGSPGMFMDRATGHAYNIRDFREGDKYDSIVIHDRSITFGDEQLFFQELQDKRTIGRISESEIRARVRGWIRTRYGT